ncbi:hypothetical protein [Neisseria montereyensis]|uniref:Phage associated protein n=1 Tax=Neisseria montereyensis TaxID=2973938 RepID=A0ABT2FDI7_9NEIS|nr:hypothetical protein [Neisseria montereyensis]MCS4534267.1 hypothetical protein [Neisseria montereyensis]
MAEIKIIIKDHVNGVSFECKSNRPMPEKSEDRTPAEEMAIVVNEFMAGVFCPEPKTKH